MSHGGPSTRNEKFVEKAKGDEARSYNFAEARPERKTTNVFESIGHLIKGCLGGGIVAMHEGYMRCGLLSALVLNVLLGILVSYCVYILIKSAQMMYGRVKEPLMTYPDLAQAALEIGPFERLRNHGKKFRYAVDWTIGIDLFGSCCVYQVVIARTIKQLVEHTETIMDEGNPHVRVYIACLLIPCILICMITSLKYLAPFSLVADVFVFIIVIATIYYGIQAASMAISDFPVYKDFLGLFEYIGMCVFSMEGVGVSMAIENSMTEPKKFPIVLICGMSVVVSLVIMIGFFGYYGFGEAAKSPVTVNFPLTPFPIVLKVFLAIIIYVTFALNFWVPFELVWFYISKRYPPEKYWLWERVYRAIFIIGITGIAIVFPNVGNFIGLLGSFCLSNMGFIYPAFIELTLIWDDPGLGFLKWRLWKCVVLCTFGLVLCVCGTYTNAKGMIKSIG